MQIPRLKLGLALSGGGAKGAFQVGVLDYLVIEKGLRFDVVAGVSTGALQAVLTAQNQVRELRQIWESLRSPRDIYRPRFGGLLGGLFGADSLYRNTPLAKKLERYVDPKKIIATGCKLRIGVVSLQTGKYRVIKETDENLRAWVLASTSIPVFFEPKQINGQSYVDGGVRDITPLGAVIHERPQNCLVVLASPLNMDEPQEKYSNLFRIGLRSVDIAVNEIYQNDVSEAEWMNELLLQWQTTEQRIQALSLDEKADELLKPMRNFLQTYRVVPTLLIAPSHAVIDTLEFEQQKISQAIEQGREAAKNAWPILVEKFALLENS